MEKVLVVDGSKSLRILDVERHNEHILATPEVCLVIDDAERFDKGLPTKASLRTVPSRAVTVIKTRDSGTSFYISPYGWCRICAYNEDEGVVYALIRGEDTPRVFQMDSVLMVK